MHLRGCLTHGPGAQGNILSVFASPYGVRTGWRIVIFLALFALLFAAIVTILAILLHHGGHAIAIPARFTPSLIAINEAALLLPILGATSAMAFLEDRPFTAYGLHGPQQFPRLAGGLVTGIASLSILVLLLLITRYGTATRGPFALHDNFRYGIEWFAVTLLVGLSEELVFRGYLLRMLERGIGFWPAACLTSALFGLLHGTNHGETIIGLFQVAAAGLLLCLSIWLTQSLWWAIGFHAGWDYAENFIFGTYDSGSSCYGSWMNFLPRGNVYLSGGLTGPEGSLFGFVILLLVAAIIWRIFGKPPFGDIGRAIS